MPHYDVYKNIEQRTGGSVYLGVVGPVRTGKSTFITRLAEQLILPYITDEFERQRIIDELPQSGNGSTIMTTQPKFVPDRAVQVNIDDAAGLSVRMVDCVGYLVDGAQGHIENDKPRMVKTPWYDYDIPFEEAAELGTKKVITDHSSIGIVLTTDGTICEIPRKSYIPAEERTVRELKAIGKPFVLVINSAEPQSANALALKAELEQKYSCAVVLLNAQKLSRDDVVSLLSDILYEFPLRSVDICLPGWATTLDREHYILSDLLGRIDEYTRELKTMRDCTHAADTFSASDYVKSMRIDEICLGSGALKLDVKLDDSLFYKVLGEQCGCDIPDERTLFSMTRELVDAKKRYDKLKSGISTVKQTGYGIVSPTMDDMRLERPELYDHNGKYGVRIRAGAPTLHMIRVDVETELSPIIGTQSQAEDFISRLAAQYDEAPDSVWSVDIFGRPLCDIVSEGLKSKVQNIPEDARAKLQSTLERVVNEGDGGMLFILL